MISLIRSMRQWAAIAVWGVLFLGLPVGSLMKRISTWQTLVEKFQAKLSNWRASTLPAAGRLTLCKSVLGTLGTYFFSLYKAPTAVINTLESLRRNFFYGGDKSKKKIVWISWNDTLAPKSCGGLGVGSLMAQNAALLSKWW